VEALRKAKVRAGNHCSAWAKRDHARSCSVIRRNSRTKLLANQISPVHSNRVYVLPIAICALVLSALAIAGTTWNLLQGSGARVSQVERSVGTSLQVLAGRLEATEANVRSAVTEASELFDRAQTERRRTSAAAARMDAGQAEPEGEAVPLDPTARRAHELRLVEQRLSGRAS